MTQTFSRTLACWLPRPLLLLTALFTLAATSLAQETAEPTEARRPKVALVLSGGGALGLSHVGAIQELEAMGIRPDIVVGTSMGAVIGGLATKATWRGYSCAASRLFTKS